MKKSLLILTLIFLQIHFSSAQENAWINYGQTYYKIQTGKDGVHRIGYEVLEQAGLNLNGLDPRSLQLFYRGEEVAVFVSGENDGSFDEQDFIEFYGKRNDATLDFDLYKTDEIPNPYFNTHTDTSAYFLTLIPDGSGRRMTIRNAPSPNLPNIFSYETEVLRIFSDQYSLGIGYNFGFRLSSYDLGQGWMSGLIRKGQSFELNFNELGAVANNPARLDLGLVGRSGNSHNVRISVGPNSNSQRVISTEIFSGFEFPQVQFEVLPSDFDQDGNLVILIQPNGPDDVDNISVSYAKLTYSKGITSGDFESELLVTDQGSSKINFTGLQENYVALDLADENNPIRLNAFEEGDAMSFATETNQALGRIWVENQNSVTEIQQAEQVIFRDLLGIQADYILVGNRELEKASSLFSNPIQAYAEHRSSEAGGAFKVLSVRVEELYDQFAYGERSSIGIFNFLENYYPIHRPTHMLLAGRSMAIYSTQRSGGITYFYRNNPSVFPFQDLIPVGGYPFSDNSYVLGLDPENPLVPAMAVGRIPARNSEELAGYLEKAIEKDQVGISAPWQKEITHLSGGISEFELARYFNFLNGFGSIAQGPFLGGNITTYRKRSNSVIEVIDVTGDLNEGRSLVTFFGHGSPTIIDIDIGFVSDPTLGYDNRGKYPVMLFNGCDYGSAFANSYTQGEDWVMTPRKGASNIMANSSIGVDVILRRYSDQFYQKAFADSSLIYRTVGEVKMEAETSFIETFGTSPLTYSHMEQMVMLGDPGARMFPAEKADYAILEEEVEISGFDGETVNSLSDSINFTFVARNLGRVDMDSLDFRVRRTLPDGQILTYDPVEIAFIPRADTLQFSLPNQGFISAGENTFTVEINSQRSVDELTFANNSVTISEFIPLSGSLNISPTDFGISPNTEVTLVSQVPGKSTSERTIIIQLDSVSDFSSSFRKEIRVSTKDLAEWDLNLENQRDSVTYYWRSKFQEIREGEADVWTNSSFSVIKDSPRGWTQRDAAQLDLNQLENLKISIKDGDWSYLDQELGIEVFTFGSGVDTLGFQNTQFFLDEVPQILDNVNNANSRLCPNGSLGLVAFQQKTLFPYLGIPIPGFDILDARACGRVPQIIQSIRNGWITDPANTILQDYVRGITEGDYVVIFSVGDVNFGDWPDRAFQSLREFGANEATLRNLKNGDPYILYGRKGMSPGEAIEIVGNPDFEVPVNEQVLSFETDLTGYFTDGWILTPRIGPARNWERFFQNVNAREWIDEENTTQFEIFGVKDNGVEDRLRMGFFEEQIDLSDISAESYPYLRLQYLMNDPESTAPSQLDRWQVNYEGVPEGVLTVNADRDRLELREGEEASLEFTFSNVSSQDFLDSIQVDYVLENVNSGQEKQTSIKIPALKAGERHTFRIDFNSVENVGANTLEVFANPRIQREQTFRNNQIDMGEYFFVEGDNTSSILDVNFDGIYIMDGDLVSPNVLITAALKNDESLLFKTDTVGMELFIRENCEGCNFNRINFSNPNLSWTPASEDNDFKVSFLPGPLADGEYTLRVVNEDSSEPYEITFEVVNESQITNFYPYPNPFSTSVRFVFTLTGSEIPDEIKIQIMTITGRVVREILQDELGPIRIGNNITDFAWDGKDEFGDQLANGVYIYRVLVRKNGQFFEHRPTAGDRGFSKGYGKMYLLR
ncbi:C25 family cysteine peptidase [Algoriphagus sediminis]|uniref:C25 family cysteine peptidase n=1 Tax=Algoriphagus sediminis TaxID=3057113 RepID=A0ABT7Y8R4_9BACT|nr:C25 family cysteine peptidase [Algoriphagus sediminis]MDN3202894.1 C25 family cysteine peptidase [Algoriphagus sediminis]